MSDVTVYVTRVCPYCVAAKALLDKKGVSYATVDVSMHPEKRVWLAEVSGQRTVPQIFIRDKPIGGYQELAALNASGELDTLLAPGKV